MAEPNGGEARIYSQLQYIFRIKTPLLEEFDQIMLVHISGKPSDSE